MKIYHTDVFSDKSLAGNGLTVVFPEQELDTEQMQKIAQEFKQFETIFLWENSCENSSGELADDSNAVFKARIFTIEEELDFAGHPILGAAAVIHQQYFEPLDNKKITFLLKQKRVVTTSRKETGHYEVVMNQGKAVWGLPVSLEWRRKYCSALNLELDELCEEYPMEVVSTGLPYLLVPVKSGLSHVKIQGTDFEQLLEENGAKFVYVFDLRKMEGRTWDNLGAVEDVATGSAAGPMGAYLFEHECINRNQEIKIHQGRFVGRPSTLKVTCHKDKQEICVAGDVKILMWGELEL